MKNHLEISIYNNNNFYSLYADGVPAWKTFNKKRRRTLLYYSANSVILLYYTYSSFREACLVRYTNDEAGFVFPGLSENVKLLFRVSASKVDKTRRAVGWLKEHTKGAFACSDDFYARLYYIIEQKGKINYFALYKLAKSYSLAI